MTKHLIPWYKVGDDFKAIIRDLTITYLIQQPSNLADFGLQYFGQLKSSVHIVREKPRSRSAEEIEMEEEIQARPGRRITIYTEPFNPEDDVNDEDVKDVFKKTDAQRKALIEQTKQVLLFRTLDDRQFSEIIDAMFEKKVEAGDQVIKQGEDGDYFYIIDHGIFEASIKDKLGNKKIIKTYNNSGSFGELALLYNMPRSATITAMTDGLLWAMKRQTFRRIVVSNSFKRRKFYEKLIDQVPMFNALESYEKLQLADALVQKSYQIGERILKQGDAADGMYFVMQGEVEISIVDDIGDDVPLKILKSGDYFGELALVTHQPRAASAFAKGKVDLAYLDVEAFERLLGPCMDVMKRNMSFYDNQMKFIRGSTVDENAIKV
ncbi:cAMP-dependent protein kinase type II regulatory subunit-like [Cimex lectularius]|uniref:cAMP-dependent protein kinase type II regulatory subunit n=1 Tax=Cimex lectularius TaxID=79782 RepID=A0A8I6S371_CIMLE|nr:cAMP-dependent protein kinase type II regulatory subunit-like [Cimex lectularius]